MNSQKHHLAVACKKKINMSSLIRSVSRFMDRQTLRSQFQAERIVRIPRFALPSNLITAITEESKSLFDNNLHQNISVQLNGARRSLETVGASQISADPSKYPTLNSFANDSELIHFMRDVTGNNFLNCGTNSDLSPAHIQRESGIGPEHGWHVDDAGYKFIILCQQNVVKDEDGGRVGYVPFFVSDEHRYLNTAERLESQSKEHQEFASSANDEDTVEILGKHVPTHFVRHLPLEPGDAYIMEGRTVCHCVTPFTKDGSVRMSAAFSFDDVHDGTNYGESANIVFGDNK